MRNKTIFLQGVLLILLTVLTGCFSSNPNDIQAFLRPDKVNVTAANYILQPPDEIELHCTRIPELDKQVQQIRPDGKVAFEAVGEIDAAGKTPKQLADAIYEKALTLYALTADNPVEVRVTKYKSRVYYVLGQVYFPGPKESTGRDTVLTALAKARPTVLAWIERIQIIRPSADKKIRPKIFEVNYDKMSAHGDTSKNVLLQEGDIIYVPPTVVAAIGLKIQEFVQPIGQAFSTVNIMETPAVR